ncbi:MAG: hypothetical protein IPN95_02175 [Bacteroidetes bacterium]|nr:hypothetical protein [Bacteroidota bacterium]
MKRLVPFFLICFVAFAASKTIAQTTSVQILANSKEVTGNLVLEGTQRLTFIVHESVVGDEAPAYEFGAIQLIPNDGSASVVLRAATVENKTNSVYSLRQNLLQTYPQGFKIRMDGVKAVFENKRVPLAINASQLEIKVLPK